ncbi:MAG: hypothetical protein H0U88_04015 [Chthoniobacterales bacterium]|nr:hypothetical protein [Chthoniobacterales bacterium]MDQ3118921.1 hypothetical protein [Verrucomicrobiota bacterium]
MSFDKVVVCSGHMIDAPDRANPRFPASKEEPVRSLIALQLDNWDVGGEDLAICGGACGADILFGEECLRRGASLRLFLAQAVGDFVRDSVQHAGSDWLRRFHKLCEKSEVNVLPEPPATESGDLSIYARVNLLIIETVRQQAAEGGKLHTLLVWDEKGTGDGPGGTSDFEARVRELGARLAIINPIGIC